MIYKIYQIILILIFVFAGSTLFAQNQQKTLKIYLNCDFCDNSYIKQNLNYVEFVRDRNFADVQLMFRSQKTGGGGTQYEIQFTGQHSFSELQDNIIFATEADDTTNEIRNLIIEHIKLGLVRYWVKNGDQANIKITQKEAKKKKEDKDPWNNWVFNLGVSGNFSGEETSKYSDITFDFAVKQVTARNKFLLWVAVSDDKSTFIYEEDKIISRNTTKTVYLSDVISINKYWSAGIFYQVGSSTYSNKEYYIWFKPGIEYNFFSYEESSKKGLTLTYKIGGENNIYFEKTIFNKEDEFLWEHSLSLSGTVNQNWGNINGDITYDSYLHDTTLKAFGFHLGTNLNLFKGFSLNLSCNYDITDNQINLAAGDLTLEELLLRQQQVKSGYNYSFYIGINYSFGSIYNTIVNPRFDF